DVQFWKLGIGVPWHSRYSVSTGTFVRSGNISLDVPRAEMMTFLRSAFTRASTQEETTSRQSRVGSRLAQFPYGELAPQRPTSPRHWISGWSMTPEPTIVSGSSAHEITYSMSLNLSYVSTPRALVSFSVSAELRGVSGWFTNAWRNPSSAAF